MGIVLISWRREATKRASTGSIPAQRYGSDTRSWDARVHIRRHHSNQLHECRIPGDQESLRHLTPQNPPKNIGDAPIEEDSVSGTRQLAVNIRGSTSGQGAANGNPVGVTRIWYGRRQRRIGPNNPSPESG